MVPSSVLFVVSRVHQESQALAVPLVPAEPREQMAMMDKMGSPDPMAKMETRALQATLEDR